MNGAYPHPIRLRGPWDCPAARDRRVTLPGRWGEGGLAGLLAGVKLIRRFGQPRQIDAHERVWLLFAGGNAVLEITLNGQQIRTENAGQCECDVTALLRPRNELVVCVHEPPTGLDLWGEVALEVRCSAYLREVQVRLIPSGEGAIVHATGTVAGSADRPLDLYVLLDGSTVIYRSVHAGQPFQVESEPLPCTPGEHAARVDLVNAATLWYVWEQTLSAGPQR